VRPIEHLRIGGIGRFMLYNVGPGRDHSFASTDRFFTEETTPGIQFQTNYVQSGGLIQYDWRDYPGEPRRGGNYIAQYSVFNDVDLGRFSFNRTDLEAQQYFSFFNQRRVIALRGRLQATDPHSGNRVPFYLQPTLGGPDDLRGFPAFRFYDNTALLLSGEYRWEVFSGLDMALFVDAGRVYHNWQDITLAGMQTDAGFGFRFNVRNAVFLRLDTGFSREGFQIWLRFRNVF
jgi:outer membrane protein assembly factor BamA